MTAAGHRCAKVDAVAEAVSSFRREFVEDGEEWSTELIQRLRGWLLDHVPAERTLNAAIIALARSGLAQKLDAGGFDDARDVDRIAERLHAAEAIAMDFAIESVRVWLAARRYGRGMQRELAPMGGNGVRSTREARPEAGEHADALIAPGRKIARYAPGDRFRDSMASGGEGPLMIVLPAGQFMMGSPARKHTSPRHDVTIGQPFAMGAYPVTFEEFDRFIGGDGHLNTVQRRMETAGRYTLEFVGGSRSIKHPVFCVSYFEALNFTKWLSSETGQLYRLPSEAEWEYAARTGSSQPDYAGSPITPMQANFGHSPLDFDHENKIHTVYTVPVDSHPANAWGLYDMLGNVMEWVGDYWHENYRGAPGDGSAWFTDGGRATTECGSHLDGLYGVIRGSSWGGPALDVTYRNFEELKDSGVHVGFRVARALTS